MILYYLLVAALPLNEHPILIYQLGPLTLVKWLGIACIPAAIVRLITQGRLPFGFKAATVAYFLYMAVALASLLTHGGRLTLGASTFGNLLSVLVLYFVTVSLVDTLQRLRIVLMVAVGSAAFASLYVIRQWQLYHNLYAGFRTWGGLTNDPNYYSMIVAMVVPVALFFARSHGSSYMRYFSWVCFGVMMAGMVCASSRGGLLGLATGLAYMSWFQKHTKWVLAVIIVLVVLGALWAPSSPLARILSPSASDNFATESRLAAWKAGLESFRRNPVFGIGMGQFRNAVEVQLGEQGGGIEMMAHNTYLEVCVELGLLGLAPFAATLVILWRGVAQASSWCRLRRMHQLHACTIVLRAGLLGGGVAAFFISAWWLRSAWLIPFLCIALTTIIRRRAELIAVDEEPASHDYQAA